MKRGFLFLIVVLCAVFLTAQACQINTGQNNPDLLPTPDIECESITDEDDFCLDSTQRGSCDADGAYSTLEVCSTGYECADANHPSQCVALPITPGGCVIGTVVDALGDAREGADVSYLSSSTTTDASGDFCLETLVGGEIALTLDYEIAGQPFSQLTDPVTISSGDTSCSSDRSACVSLGTIPADAMTSVSGSVVDTQGTGLEGRTVLSNTGGMAVTNSVGGFCMAIPVFRDTKVYAEASLDSIFVPPPEFFAQAGDPSCTSGSSNIVLLQPYTQTTCVVGSVLGSDGTPLSGLPVDVFADGFPDYPLIIATTGADGVFCTVVPAATSNLEVSVGGLVSYSTVDVETYGSGETCDEENPYGECFDLGSVTLP
jgi:hypothetical protein